MANPLLRRLGQSQTQNQNQNKNIVQAFKEFKANFKGDPQVAINNMLKSGQVSQEQVDKATEWANMVKGLLSK